MSMPGWLVRVSSEPSTRPDHDRATTPSQGVTDHLPCANTCRTQARRHRGGGIADRAIWRHFNSRVTRVSACRWASCAHQEQDFSPRRASASREAHTKVYCTVALRAGVHCGVGPSSWRRRLPADDVTGDERDVWSASGPSTSPVVAQQPATGRPRRSLTEHRPRTRIGRRTATPPAGTARASRRVRLPAPRP